MQDGWGYGPNIFYNPISTYIPCIIALFTETFINSIKIFFCLNIFLAAEFMYMFTKNITKKNSIGIMTAVIYILNPYYLGNIFIRGAIGEIAALTFLPLLFLGLYDLIERQGKKHYFIIIGAVGIALSHNITLVYSAIFSIIYFLINIRKIIKKPKEIIKYCIIDIIFITTLTAFYTIPLMMNKTNADYAIFDHELMWTNNKFASDNTIKIEDLFDNNKDNVVIYKIGLPIIIGITLLLLFQVKIKENDRKILTTFLILGIGAIFIATKYFPWDKVPEFFCVLQFPWRMLGFANFFLSFCAGYGIINFLELKFKDKDDILIGFVVIISFLSMLYVYKYSGLEIQDKEDDHLYEEYYGSVEKLNIDLLNKEYLPVKAYEKSNDYLKERDKDKVSVIKGRAEIKEYNKTNNKIEIKIRNTYAGTILEFPYLYYLGYKAEAITDTGEQIEIETFESKNGFVAIEVPDKDTNIIIVEYKIPKGYKIAYFISAISFITAIIIVIFKIKNSKKINKSVETNKIQ